MNILKKTKGLLFAVMLIMLAGVRAVAQDVSFTAQAPQAVVVGERFRITYKVNTRDAKEFRAPDMKNINRIATTHCPIKLTVFGTTKARLIAATSSSGIIQLATVIPS